MSNLLISEPPLQVLPSLAVALKSIDKAVILQQVHYWLQRSQNIEDGHKWVFNTIKGWHEQFPWLAEKTVQRYLKDLCDKGLLITGNFNKANFDRTKWYRINYEALDNLTQSKGTDSPNGKEPVVPLERDSVTSPIPIDYTENTQENKDMSKSEDLHVSALQKEFDVLWGMYPKYKKQGKQKAFSSYGHWRKASKENSFERAKAQLSKYLKYIKVKSVATEYIKAAKTWFANVDDEYDLSPTPTQYQKQSYGQKRVEKGTDWSKKKAKAPSTDVYADELKNYFKDLEESTGVIKNE